MSADPSATPRVDVEEGQSQTSMDISPSTETSRLEELVSLTGSYQRIRWGSKVGMKDHTSRSYRGNFFAPRFARTGVTEGSVV